MSGDREKSTSFTGLAELLRDEGQGKACCQWKMASPLSLLKRREAVTAQLLCRHASVSVTAWKVSSMSPPADEDTEPLHSRWGTVQGWEDCVLLLCVRHLPLFVLGLW